MAGVPPLSATLLGQQLLRFGDMARKRQGDPTRAAVLDGRSIDGQVRPTMVCL